MCNGVRDLAARPRVARDRAESCMKQRTAAQRALVAPERNVDSQVRRERQ